MQLKLQSVNEYMESRWIMTRQILFLCPHSAAKSVMAAAYFDQLAAHYGLSWRAAFAGTEPDETISPKVAALLEAEGINTSQFVPRRVTAEDLALSDIVVSLDCPLDEFPAVPTPVQYWNDVATPSQDLHKARDQIYELVETLVAELKLSNKRTPQV
jgi:arsenate reductase (thioredoxin)